MFNFESEQRSDLRGAKVGRQILLGILENIAFPPT